MLLEGALNYSKFETKPKNQKLGQLNAKASKHFGILQMVGPNKGRHSTDPYLKMTFVITALSMTQWYFVRAKLSLHHGLGPVLCWALFLGICYI